MQSEVANMKRTTGFLRPLTIDYRPGQYVKELDGWRFIAVMAVIFMHYIPSIFLVGWVVMDLFFVLSGFLITGILLDTKNEKGYYKNFIVRRVIRLFPLYYLCLFIVFYLIPDSFFDVSYYRNHQLWYWLYSSNWLIALQGWSPTKALDHFWSLGIEEQFYVLWPLFVWLLTSKHLVRLCIFLFFASIILRNTGLQFGFVMPYPYVATIARMEPIALGAIVALLLRKHKVILEKIALPAALVAGICSLITFIIAGTVHMENIVNYSINYTFLDIFFAGMLAVTLSKNLPDWARKFLTHPLIRKIAGMTYCLYVFHVPIHSILKYKYLPLLQQYTGNPMSAFLIMFIIGMVITFPLCYAIHRWIEAPLWKLKRYF
jgi:peptidoglycan/LPS O-acetylase OafA/YrhL